MSQSFLDVTRIPASFDQLSRVAMSQKMCMDRDIALPAVVAKQPFDCLAIERVPVGRVAPFILGISFEHDKKMVGLETMLQEKMIEQSHQGRRKVDEALFPFYQALGKCSIFKPWSPPKPNAISMKFQVLNEQAKHLTHAETTLPHE